MVRTDAGNRINRRHFLSELMAFTGYTATRPLIDMVEPSKQCWLEIVQDKYDSTKWYLNLYEGFVFGNLEKASLKKHWIESEKAGGISKNFSTYPYRIWYSNGERRQSFK
ncbi:MAG: hypothetical protein U1D67_05990 [Dehalococcoidia bacterium]|nr:hypothetical protein [Dehalococcoidia bacterium]MDZ4246649.1 hypothetical protein [Dehalococcoidia bacterium]